MTLFIRLTDYENDAGARAPSRDPLIFGDNFTNLNMFHFTTSLKSCLLCVLRHPGTRVSADELGAIGI